MSDALINGLAGAGGGIIAQLITYPLQTVRFSLTLFFFLSLISALNLTFFFGFVLVILSLTDFSGKYTATNGAWSEEGEEEAWYCWANVSGFEFFIFFF